MKTSELIKSISGDTIIVQDALSDKELKWVTNHWQFSRDTYLEMPLQITPMIKTQKFCLLMA